MAALGVLISFARVEPGAAEALAARGGVVADRSRSSSRSSARVVGRSRVPRDGTRDVAAVGAARRRRDGRSRQPAARGRRRAAPPAPARALTVLGTAEGLEARLVPEHGLAARARAARAAARRPSPTGSACPAGCARRSGPRATRSTSPGRRSSSGSAATSRRPPTSPPGVAGRRRHPRGRTRARAWRTGSAPGGRRRVAVTFPGTRPARRPAHGPAAAARRSPACSPSARPTPRGARAAAAAELGPGPDPADAPRLRRLARRGQRQRGRRRAPPPSSSPRASRCCT